MARRVNGVRQTRERLELPDGDFLDLDWSRGKNESHRLAILLHGLEGNAQRAYITGSAKLFNEKGVDACAVNLRSCSGTINRLFRSYHSGATEDLDSVIQHILSTRNYGEILIKGFSLGGNLTLKYLGEGRKIPPQIKAAVGISVPCSLHSSLKQLLRPENSLYAMRFKKRLIEKLRLKQRLFPDKITDSDIRSIITLKDFDDVYTSKAHGFRDALDYYEQCSCRQFLNSVTIPTLIINAQNDSFLGTACYPVNEAIENPRLYLEIPEYGGHVGFHDKVNYYTEKRALKFFNELG